MVVPQECKRPDPADLCMMVFPTGVEPVNPTFLTSGWLDSASPITAPATENTSLQHIEYRPKNPQRYTCTTSDNIQLLQLGLAKV